MDNHIIYFYPHFDIPFIPDIGHLSFLSPFFSSFLKLINYFIYFWVRRVSAAARGRPPPSCSEQGPLLRCSVQAPHCGGLSHCGTRALGAQASAVVARGLSSCGSWALERSLSSCGTRT